MKELQRKSTLEKWVVRGVESTEKRIRVRSESERDQEKVDIVRQADQ